MTDDASVGHFGDDLGGEVIIGGEFGGEEGRAEEFLEGVGDAVEEFQDEERLNVIGGWGEEEEVVMDDGEEDGGRFGRGEVNYTRSGRGMLEVEWEEYRWRWRTVGVDMIEEDVAISSGED